MDTYTATKNRILQLCGQRNITINKLAAISALPPSSIKNILYGRSSDPRLLTIKKICDGLEITLAEFLTRKSSTHWNLRLSEREEGKPC